MKTITVKEAVEKVNAGQSLEGYTLDQESSTQVNVRDAMTLNEGGIVVPEANLYYQDDQIVYDDEIDELIIGDEITGMSWEEKAKLAAEATSEESSSLIDLSTREPEIDAWIKSKKHKLADLLRPIVVSLFRAEKSLKE